MWYKLTIAILALVGSIFINPIYAFSYNIQPNSNLHYDPSLVNTSSISFHELNGIKIFDFTTSDPTLSLSTQSYVEGLMYYLSSNYGEPIPFTYLVGWDGSIYQGADLGETTFNGDDSITIAYLDDGNGLTDVGKDSLIYLLTQVSSKTGLGDLSINASGFTYANGNFTLADPASSWKSYVDGVSSSMKGIIPDKSVNPSYMVKINSALVTTGDNVSDLIVSFTNNSHTSLYGRVYGGDDKSSPLYVQGVWVSQTRSNSNLIGTIDTGDIGKVDIKIPLGLKSGTYHLALYTDTSKIGGSDLAININESQATVGTVTPTPQASITIGSTGTGYLNVHSSPSLYATVISKVNTGSSYVLIQSQNGWDEIKYDNTHNGWVDGEYVK